MWADTLNAARDRQCNDFGGSIPHIAPYPSHIEAQLADSVNLRNQSALLDDDDDDARMGV